MSSIYKVIGLMSGTSLDGVDLAHCQFEEDGKWTFQILNTETVEYPSEIRDKLTRAVNLSGLELTILDRELGGLYGQLVIDFMKQYTLEPQLVASHGHTIFHQPEKRLSFQAGNGLLLAMTSELPVICDFRSQDVNLGGQGAPLVPVGDHFLFPDYSACINLGGIANISFPKDDIRYAYDISPANMPLNLICASMGLPYDEDGKIARSGEIDDLLLDDLEGLDYYRQSGPRSLGYEWVSQEIMGRVSSSGLDEPDILRTLVEHISLRITDECSRNEIKGKVLLTGGGSLNLFLLERIFENSTPQIDWEIPDHDLIVYKEALIFAFLGVLRLRGEDNVFCSVTGTEKDHCSGQIIDPYGRL